MEQGKDKNPRRIDPLPGVLRVDLEYRTRRLRVALSFRGRLMVGGSILVAALLLAVGFR